MRLLGCYRCRNTVGAKWGPTHHYYSVALNETLLQHLWLDLAATNCPMGACFVSTGNNITRAIGSICLHFQTSHVTERSTPVCALDGLCDSPVGFKTFPLTKSWLCPWDSTFSCMASIVVYTSLLAFVRMLMLPRQ